MSIVQSVLAAVVFFAAIGISIFSARHLLRTRWDGYDWFLSGILWSVTAATWTAFFLLMQSTT